MFRCYSFRMIYVIELMDLPGSKPYSVNVEIKRSRRNFEKQLYLILKSTSKVHWHVFTTKIKAQVDIVVRLLVVFFAASCINMVNQNINQKQNGCLSAVKTRKQTIRESG